MRTFTKTLTDRQREVLDVLRAHERTVVDLSVREIGDLLDIRSPNGVIAHLNALEHKRFITRDRVRARGIQIVKEK